MPGPGCRSALVALAAVAALAGCGATSGGGSASATSAGAGAAAAATSTATSSGCGRSVSPTARATGVAITGDVVQSLRVEGLARSYRLAVPTGYRSSAPSPLILLFHGSGSDALQTSAYTQLPKRGLPGRVPGGHPRRGRRSVATLLPGARTDDLDFVSTLVSDLSSRYCVDRDRIYAAGISLGSEFASIVGCTRRDQIAAIGLVAAEFLLRPCPGPLPVVAFHGTADPIVAYRQGGVGAALPGIKVVGVEEDQAQGPGLTAAPRGPTSTRSGSMVVRRTWSGCRGGSAVVLYSVLGGGHTWPGSPIDLSTTTFGATTHQIDATGLMLAFFGRHRLER